MGREVPRVLATSSPAHARLVGASQGSSTPLIAFVMLLAFVVVEYTRPGIYLPVLDTLHVNSAVPLLAVVLAALTSKGRPNEAIFADPTTRWLLFLVALFGIQFFTSDVRLYIYETLTAVTGYLLIYYAMLRNTTTIARMRGLFGALVIVHIVMLLLNPQVILEPEKRHYIGGTFLGDGNDFAWSSCIVVPFAIYLCRTATGRFARYFFFCAFLLLFVAVIGTQSRGGSVAFGAILLYMIARSRRPFVGLAWAAALVAIVLAFAPAAYFERMNMIVAYEEDGSAQGRIMAWKSAIRMAEDHPIVGVGAGHFGVKFGFEYLPPGYGRRELPLLNAHSIYFLALGEFGFPGIIFLISVLLLSLFRNERIVHAAWGQMATSDRALRELALAVQGGLIGFIVGGAFLSGLYYPHLYIVLALCVSVHFLARTHQRERILQRAQGNAVGGGAVAGPPRDAHPSARGGGKQNELASYRDVGRERARP